mmetsp:Transcript_20749/g.26848  ORF Transcript_20749/g.26848 Transcript_20749/m.26848 type:complete len:750 (-) Transcript_20749:309-2558(-)
MTRPKPKHANPPRWGNSVRIFSPPRSEEEAKLLQLSIEELLANVNPKNPHDLLDWRGSQNGHFSSERWALLFSAGHINIDPISKQKVLARGMAEYKIDFAVGYYTQVLGLGRLPSQVNFVGKLGPYCKSLDQRQGGAGSLNTFWRSIENVKIQPSGKKMYWAVSQAAPMRRVEVIGNLLFADDSTRKDPSNAWGALMGSNYASGGFAANIKVTQAGDFEEPVWFNEKFTSVKRPTGETQMGSQQQFFLRNCSFAMNPSKDKDINTAPLTTIEASDLDNADPEKVLPISNCAWNLVQVGCINSKATTQEPKIKSNKEPPTSLTFNLPKTPSGIAEKPFIIETWEEENQKFSLMKPDIRIFQTHGVTFSDSYEYSEVGLIEIPFEYVFYADAEVLGNDASLLIQAELDQGYHIVFGPGIFQLTHTLQVSTPDQILLGIGFATLKPPPDGSPCIRVSPAIHGVRIAGLTLQAAKLASLDVLPGSTLLEWGTWQPSAGSSDKIAGVLSDIFCRVGGPDDTDRQLVGCDTMIRINSHNVVGDNLWLWRADHSALAPGEKPDATEAFHLVRQPEFPSNTCLEVFGENVTMYGLACEHALKHNTMWYGQNGKCYFYQCELPYDAAQSTFQDYAGYCLDSSVISHTAAGVGIYSFFRDHQVIVKSAIVAPSSPMIHFQNAFSRFLQGHMGILNVINSSGGPSYANNKHDSSWDGVFPKIYTYPPRVDSEKFGLCTFPGNSTYEDTKNMYGLRKRQKF